MNYFDLASASKKAIAAIDDFSAVNGSNSALDSIRAQMEFIKLNSVANKNPVIELGERKFTYSIIASRELSSPDELKLKNLLDEVSRVMDGN